MTSGALPGRDLYDDPAFFAGYQHLRTTGAGLNEELERPALARLLLPVAGTSVVELGCGDGPLTRRLADAGAQQVLAVDSSHRMLTVAGRQPHPRVRYLRSDPICTAASPMSGWRTAGGTTVWPVDNYADETTRTQRWLGRTVRKHHHRLTTLIGGVLDASLVLTGIDEPWPGDEATARHPDLAQHRRRPPLLLLAAAKPTATATANSGCSVKSVDS